MITTITRSTLGEKSAKSIMEVNLRARGRHQPHMMWTLRITEVVIMILRRSVDAMQLFYDPREAYANHITKF